MKILNIFFVVIITAFCFNMQAQQMEPVLIPDKFPEYPGGDKELQKFYMNNIIYPKEAKEKGIEQTIVVDLIIEEDGSFSDIKLFDHIKYDFELGEEAIRVINLMPKWKPGQINGKNVRTRYPMFVRFSLDSTFNTNTITPQQNLEEYRFFSTDIFENTTDEFVQVYKTYYIKLFQNGIYKMGISETQSHKISYDNKTDEYVYSDLILDTIISEGSYIEKNHTLILIDKHSKIQLKYHCVYDTLEGYNKLKPIQTLPFLNNIPFLENIR
jgi:hypothetical protein